MVAMGYSLGGVYICIGLEKFYTILDTHFELPAEAVQENGS